MLKSLAIGTLLPGISFLFLFEICWPSSESPTAFALPLGTVPWVRVHTPRPATVYFQGAFPLLTLQQQFCHEECCLLCGLWTNKNGFCLWRQGPPASCPSVSFGCLISRGAACVFSEINSLLWWDEKRLQYVLFLGLRKQLPEWI